MPSARYVPPRPPPGPLSPPPSSPSFSASIAAMAASLTAAASTPASGTPATELLELDVAVPELFEVDGLVEVLAIEAVEPLAGLELGETDIEAAEVELEAPLLPPLPGLEARAELEAPISDVCDPEPADPPVGVSAGSKSTTSRPHAETSAHVAPTRQTCRSLIMAKRAPPGARPPE